MSVPYKTAYIRCRCGGRALLVDGAAQFTDKHARLGVVPRYRKCEACSFKFLTSEIDAAELADLRRRAYLYEREIGSATEVKP